MRTFAGRLSKKFGKRLDQISQQTMDRLMRYAWPGNVRELENVIERAAILSPGPVLQVDEVLFQSDQAAAPDTSRTLEEVERAHITLVLQEVDWVVEGKQGAATRLGLHPNTLRSRMQKLGIKKPRPSS
ncbi:MAG: hypothetical protein JNL98_42990 [Bryobacterales bacterium]|nr:hypothetical protein [Bryobacterales bacterium]